MADQIIGATLQVDATSAAAASKTTTELKQNIKDLKKAFEDTKTGSAEQATAFKKLQAAQDDLSKSTAGLSKATEEGGGHFANIREKAASLPGPLGEAGEGANKLNANLLKLLANPVGLVIAAIVGVLVLLYKSFTNTFEGGEKMEQIFAGIGAAAKVLLDRIFALGGAVLKLFSGDFTGALSDAKKAVTGIGDAVKDAYNKVAGLTGKIQELTREQRAQDIEAAKRATELAKLREQLNDESVPLAEKKKAAKELRDLEKQAADESLKTATGLANAKIELLKQGTDGEKKNAQAIADLQIDLEHKKTDAELEGVRTNKVIRNLDKQDKAERKAEELKEKEEEKKIREQNQAFQAQLAKLQNENELAGITDKYTKEKQILENKLKDEQAVIQKDFENKKINRAQFDQLEAAQAKSAQIQRDGLETTHKKELADKEVSFQKDLQGILAKTREDTQADIRALEKAKLKDEHDKQLAAAVVTYKDDAIRFQAIKQALDDQLKAEQDKLDQKNLKEDAKKNGLTGTTNTSFIVAREHAKSGLRVIATTKPGDGEEVRDLPDEDDREQSPGSEIE